MAAPERQPNPAATAPGHTPWPVRLIDRFNETLGKAVSWLTLAMVVVTFLVVVLRYAFDLGWIAMQESVTYMHAVVFMIGAAFTFKHRGHVRVDILYGRMDRRGRAWVDLLGGLLLLLPMCLFIVWVGWDYVATSWSVTEGSREAGGLPGVFLLKALIIVMPVLVALQALAGVVRDLLVLLGRNGSDTEAGGGGV